jgi:uncharacterized protein (TIGR02246 family)
MSTHFDAIKSAYHHFAAGWQTNDGATVAAAFVEDGALINPFGQRAEGRSAIAAMYTEYFAGMLGGTTTSFKLANVRGVENNHAFADAEQIIRGRGGEVVLVVHLAALLRRERDGWRFVDARPYVFANPPV